MRIAMMGTGTFAEPTFEALLTNFGPDVVGLVTQPQRDAGNKRGSTRQTGQGMANIAAARREPLTILQPESINTPEGVAALRELRPDLMVVAAYGQILSKDVLTIPSVGTINVHASLLPKYRGAAPVAYAILNGERETGVTIIKVTPGLDSGDMILQETIAIPPEETTGEVESRLAFLGARLAVAAVLKYRSGQPVIGVKQDPALVTKAPKIKKEQGLIDWSKSAEEICRHVRAMQPWPTAYTFLHRPGKDPLRVIVKRARVADRGSELQPPGAIMCDVAAEERVEVAAGPGNFLKVMELQIAGKKPMTAGEFHRGYVFSGVSFGGG
ncbi:MAG TPA: methionyl-tRNA formyltransferase [Urbifossiella sp.]|nr:methionyl-tRNA formyltransferase [Urbifossiella sp.]